MTNHWIDLKNADVVFVIGGNPAENHPASMRWINKAREDRNAKLVVVDPRVSRTAARADLYAPIRSGTDIAFIGGLINYTIANRLYNDEYVRYYTNALTLIDDRYAGPADLDGVFSGFDGAKKKYDPATWQYQTQTTTQALPDGTTKEVTVPLLADSLDDPRCVFQKMKQHFARYTPEMVERVCGTPKDKFLAVAKMFCETGSPAKAGTILYAMGQTQHTVGSQNVRVMAMLQLLLGNMGIPGGGVNALRGESNVQGSTDMGLLYHDLPGYLGLPTEKHDSFEVYAKKFDATSFWSNGPKFFSYLMKAWYGDKATAENGWAFDYLPKAGGDYSWIPLFQALHAGKLKGLFAMGMNPAVSGPNSRMERKALANLDFLVVMELFETETAAFWYGPGQNPKDVKTEVFLLPAADAMEKAGSIGTSGRLIQWRDKVATAHGEAKDDGWILGKLTAELKKLYAGSTAEKDRPILDLLWDYGGDKHDPNRVAREINGVALTDIKDPTGKVIAEAGKTIPFAALPAAEPGAIAAGCWIYAGYFANADDGTGVIMPAAKRRGKKDPGDMGTFPFWGWAWPANRRILYNRASARPDGTPWAPDRKFLWWDEAQKKWAGYDVPDFPPARPPMQPADPLKAGLAGQAGTDAFLMKSDGKAWLFTPKGMNEGPFPEHYEPIESPVQNLLSKAQNNPMAKVYKTDADKEIGDKIGKAAEFPIVCTTYRVTEHWQAGGMSRTLPWLSETQPDLYIELSKELAAEKGIKNGDKITVSSARGKISAVAMVTARFKPLKVDGRIQHQIGMPWHYGWKGIATGAHVNDLTPHFGDANTGIPEYKAFLVNVQKGAV
jgi:formate dehydrogenase major subunit